MQRHAAGVILLSDTLGASMLVDAINHRLPAGATASKLLGPFHVADPPALPQGADISGGAPGTPMLVRGSVRASDGRPLAGAVVDTWLSDSDGFYDVQHYGAGGGVAMRGRLHADAEGRFRFWSVVPKFYPIPDDGPVGRMLLDQGRHPYGPAHVHFMIAAKGCATPVTHVFVAEDPYLGSDMVFGVKDSLVRAVEQHPPGTAPDGRRVDTDRAALDYDFVLAPTGAA